MLTLQKTQHTPKLNEYILTLTCQDQIGIVAAIATTLAEMMCNIEESSQYGDSQTRRFFMRVRFSMPDKAQKASLLKALSVVADKFAMEWALHEANYKARIILIVSKFGHCLHDVLYRWKTGELPIEIVRVISNHTDFQKDVENEGIPFEYLPVSSLNKKEQEKKLFDIFQKDRADLVVLARYMQILSDELSTKLFGRVINIHHSFLPSFKGARPYHQAHDRGVKLIGATAHYVTADLDEGPIIEQEIERVDHTMSVDDLIRAGRDIERRVLSHAIKYHIEHRILMNDFKTVIFK